MLEAAHIREQVAIGGAVPVHKGEPSGPADVPFPYARSSSFEPISPTLEYTTRVTEEG